MTKKILAVLMMAVCVPLLAAGQTDQQKKIQAAYDVLRSNDYAGSLKLFQELHAATDRNGGDFPAVAYGFAASRFCLVLVAAKKDDWNATIGLAGEFLKTIDADKDVLARFPDVLERRYWVCKNLIVAHFGLGRRDLAKTYQDILYEAYRRKQLPQGLDQCYCFEKIVVQNLNIWGYENFAQPEDREPRPSFSKQVYYVFSRDAEGNDKDELYTLETVRVHKLTGDEPDYVLTKKMAGPESVRSESYWTFTFDDPVDYGKLHEAVVKLVTGGAQPNSVTTIKRPQQKS